MPGSGDHHAGDRGEGSSRHNYCAFSTDQRGPDGLGISNHPGKRVWQCAARPPAGLPEPFSLRIAVKVASRLALGAYGVTGTVLNRLLSPVACRWQDPVRERAFRELCASQWWSRDRLQVEQWRSVQRLLRHAYDNVPYYRDAFHSVGAEPDDFRELPDLTQLPVLRKEDIQANRQRLKATGGYDPRGVHVNHTGGSTGAPLTIWQDASYWAWCLAELDRDFRMCGYRPGQRQAFLWGSDYDSAAHKGLQGKLRDLISNMRWVDAFDLDADRLRAAIAELVVFLPHLIVGYVSSLTLLAQLIQGEGLEAPRPRAVQTSAEVLTPAARSLIERTLGGRCFDRYGCREVGNIAQECDAHSGLHLLMEGNYTEFVGEDGKPAAEGETGETVVTNLRNYVMPLIRYANGDVGVPSGRRCACGRGLPLIERVQGRVTDIIVTPTGRLLHGEFFTHLFYGLEGVRQFQVEQVTLRDLIVRMVAESDAAFDGARAALEMLIARHGDAEFRLRFERAAKIAPAQSGKYRFTLSHVPVPFGGKKLNAVDG